jgi:tetratricopeptide (TPR) repeat protein
MAPRVIALLVLTLLTGCAGSREARASLDAGRRAVAARSFREALVHFRTAVQQAPDFPAAHVARGDAAEALGEFEEALAAYRHAVRLAPSHVTRLRLGSLAARTGQLELATQSLDGADGPWRQHALVGVGVGAARLAICMPRHWPQVGPLWRVCVSDALEAGQAARASSRERVASYRFELLVEAGARDAALALARQRGWVRDDASYCRADDLPVSASAAALLAMLLQPQDADCLVTVGARTADDGLVRLGRLMLTDRLERSASPEARAEAAWALRYRLPAADPAKLAESLNVTGWRLQHRFGQPPEALAAFQRAIAADPAFSWPYHNIGRLHLEQGDLEQARAWLAKAVEVNPNHWRAQLNLAVALQRARRHDEALAAYERAATMHPEDADTHASIGWLLVKTGRDAEGRRALQTAVRLDPDLERERQYLERWAAAAPTAGSAPETGTAMRLTR